MSPKILYLCSFAKGLFKYFPRNNEKRKKGIENSMQVTNFNIILIHTNRYQ